MADMLPDRLAETGPEAMPANRVPGPRALSLPKTDGSSYLFFAPATAGERFAFHSR